MMPQVVAGPVDGYVELLRRELAGSVAAVYAAGSLALGDFSARQSNVDLVVVADSLPDAATERRLRRRQTAMDRPRRPAEVWHTTWEEISGGPAVLSRPSALATPLTWAILRHDPMPLFGPDWPVAWDDESALRAWAVSSLRDLAATNHGMLVLRRAVVPLVLEAARLAQMAITGRVLSKSEAGESVTGFVSSSHRRVLVDSVGYRRGAQTSMYWGPFERKYDALAVVAELARAAGAA
jgi:hypothetical protein